jgi:hypothetical protein
MISRRGLSALIAGALAAGILGSAALPAAAQNDDLAKKVEALTRRVEALSAKAPAAAEEAPKPNAFAFGGDLRVRHDVLRGKIPAYTQFLGTFTGSTPNTQSVPSQTVRNDSLLTTRLGLDLHARPMEGVTLKVRVLADKTWVMEDQGATQAGYFADRQNASFDGSMGHVPADNSLRLDQAYATVKDLWGLPAWFSLGRRPSTGGVPTNVRDTREVSGGSGTPGLMIDYAFDGGTLGMAPEIEALPGFEAKVCAGRGYDAGYVKGGVGQKDTNMIGVAVLLTETPDARVDLQYDRAFDIFDTIPGPNVRTNLGDIEQYGGSLLRVLRELGPGDLTVFGSGAASVATPNSNRYNAGFGAGNPGLMCDGADCAQKTGYAFYVGARYDVSKTKTKLGAEFNRGSKDWITFVPAGDDAWTSKLGARGNVYELYAVQDLGRAPITRDARVFFRLGWQYYDFQYTGSNSWVGTPKRIKDLTLAQMQFMAPLKSAYDVYTTFEVRF